MRWYWLSLRVPWDAPHGDHPGAFGTRVQPRSDLICSHSDLRGREKAGDVIKIHNPSQLPDVGSIAEMREPIVLPIFGRVSILECDQAREERRGVQRDMQFVGLGLANL